VAAEAEVMAEGVMAEGAREVAATVAEGLAVEVMAVGAREVGVMEEEGSVVEVRVAVGVAVAEMAEGEKGEEGLGAEVMVAGETVGVVKAEAVMEVVEMER
jgi:hypothetical protein